MRFLKRVLLALLVLLGLMLLLLQVGPDSDTDADVDEELGRGYYHSAGPASPAAAPLYYSCPRAAASPAGQGLR